MQLAGISINTTGSLDRVLQESVKEEMFQTVEIRGLSVNADFSKREPEKIWPRDFCALK